MWWRGTGTQGRRDAGTQGRATHACQGYPDIKRRGLLLVQSNIQITINNEGAATFNNTITYQYIPSFKCSMLNNHCDVIFIGWKALGEYLPL